MNNNKQFESLLLAECIRYVKISPESYCRVTLDSMWNGETYSDNDGNDYYHEIRATRTKSGAPCVVTL